MSLKPMHIRASSTIALHAALALLLLPSAAGQPPCTDDARYRQFDFWIGSWDVYTPNRDLVGTNDIAAEEAGCVLVERWVGGQGSTGMSINFFDPRTETWRQQWVAAAGYLVELEGGLSGNAMVLEGALVQADGSEQPMRGTWTPLDDGRVRQHFEVADSSGTWSTWFDGFYQRDEDG